MPIGDFVTVLTLLVNGVPLLPVSLEMLQNVYGSGSTSAQPLYYANYGGDAGTGGNDFNIFQLGPIPDQAYPVTAVGTVRLASLNTFNQSPQAGSATTFISQFLPDLMLQAAMIYVSEFQRNFGAAAGDPQMAMTYEQQYQSLLKGVVTEEARKRFWASGWSSDPPAVVASDGRQG
jgi:hypothetical protein